MGFLAWLSGKKADSQDTANLTATPETPKAAEVKLVSQCEFCDRTVEVGEKPWCSWCNNWATKSHRFQSKLGPVQNMSEAEIIDTLKKLCSAYKSNSRGTIAALEPTVTLIGELLNHRGGINEMRRIFKKLDGTPGARTLEMHWNGIGLWMG